MFAEVCHPQGAVAILCVWTLYQHATEKAEFLLSLKKRGQTSEDMLTQDMVTWLSVTSTNILPTLWYIVTLGLSVYAWRNIYLHLLANHPKLLGKIPCDYFCMLMSLFKVNYSLNSLHFLFLLYIETWLKLSRKRLKNKGFLNIFLIKFSQVSQCRY